MNNQTSKGRLSLGLTVRLLPSGVALTSRKLAVKHYDVPAVRQHADRRRVQEVVARLNAIAEPNEALRWLDTHQARLGGLSPMELLQRGRFEPVLGAIIRVEQGLHT